MEFSRQEYCSGLPFPSPGVFPSREDLPYLGLKPGLLHCRQILYHLSHWSLLNVLILAFPPFCFWDLYHYFGASLLSFLWILFHIVCLFLLNLFGLVSFCLVPSFAQHFSVFSFFLTYCVWGLFSPGYRVMVLLFGLCPRVWGWSSGSCRLCVGRNWCLHSSARRWVYSSLMGRAMWGGVFGVSMGSLSADVWVYVFVFLVLWVRHPSLGAASSWVMLVLVYRWRPSWESSLINMPWGKEFFGGVLHSALPPQRLRPDLSPENRDPTSHFLWH